MMKFKKNRAFTFLELVIVMTLFAVILGATVPQILQLFFRNELGVAGDSLVHTLRRAQNYSTQQVFDSAWGVQFDATGQTYTFFSGTGYDVRNTARDLVIELPDTVTFGTISLTGGATGVVFDQVSGATSQTGTVILNGSDLDTSTVTIGRYGTVTIQ